MEWQDRKNREAWSDPGAIKGLAALQSFTDEGERAAYWRIVDEVRDKPILDLGVGSGRTVPLLRSLTDKYVAIDYLPPMVDFVRKRFPFIDVREGDARDLSRLPDSSFQLVAFSYMGIDSVDHDGRQRILSGVHRVLKPNGIFWFSTLNKSGKAPRYRPWRLQWPQRGHGKIRYALAVLDQVVSAPKRTRNYLRSARFSAEGDGWSVGPFFPHDYSLVAHYTTLAAQRAELQRAGFRAHCQVFADSGASVREGDDLRDVFCFNILARK